jgi:hypothetical protein
LLKKLRCRKGLITYFKTNRTIAMKKHLDVEHANLAKNYLKFFIIIEEFDWSNV